MPKATLDLWALSNVHPAMFAGNFVIFSYFWPELDSLQLSGYYDYDFAFKTLLTVGTNVA